jgi:RNA polymerase sigma factor for flagellar operon FliA
MADLAARVGSDEKRLSRTIVRINTIESTSPLATGEHVDEGSLPRALVPSEPDSPHTAYEKVETRERVYAAIAALPWRERKVIGLYYYGQVTMKEIGAEIGVNESRVSQLHARAIKRLRDTLGSMNPQQAADLRNALLTFASRQATMAKATLPKADGDGVASSQGVVLRYRAAGPRPTPARATLPGRRPRTAVAAAR